MSAPQHLPAEPSGMFNMNDPTALVCVVSPRICEGINLVKDIVESNDEETLRKKVKPSKRDEELRVSFWNEYSRAVSTGESMTVDRVTKGICSVVTFYAIMKDSERFAYLLTVRNVGRSLPIVRWR